MFSLSVTFRYRFAEVEQFEQQVPPHSASHLPKDRLDTQLVRIHLND